MTETPSKRKEEDTGSSAIIASVQASKSYGLGSDS